MPLRKIVKEIDLFLQRAKRLKPYSEAARQRKLEKEWKQEADDALAQDQKLTVLSLAERVIENRLSDCEDEDEEEAKLQAITDDHILATMEVLDVNRREAGLPTFSELVSAYQHVDSGSSEGLLKAQCDYGNHDAADELSKIEWLKEYFKKRYPEESWSWPSWANQHPEMEDINWLVDETIESGDDTPE